MAGVAGQPADVLGDQVAEVDARPVPPAAAAGAVQDVHVAFGPLGEDLVGVPRRQRQHKFGAAFQAVEALHHRPGFTGSEMDRRSHQERVAAIVRAAQAAGVEDETVAWAERVLRSRNDKPLTQKIEDVVRSAGACGDAVLKAAPTFPSTVAGERAGVSHPGVGRSLDAADRYWYGEVLTWIARRVLLAAAGVNDMDRRTVARAAFQHAVEQLGPTVESVSGSG
jgi:Apea-like HEPN